MALGVVRYDLRRSKHSSVSHHDLYREALAQAKWADDQGLDMVVLSEHHGDPGGYLSSPLTLAAAIGAVTERIPMIISALLVPLHDPIRVAEDIVAVDLISNGRIWIVTGIGYRPAEYTLLDKDFSARGALLDEAIGVMLKAWTGEPFEYRGETRQVLPRPVQQPHPQMFIGGSAPVSARRAARYGLSFFPSADKPELADVYYAECEKLGTSPGMVLMPKGPAAVFVSEDPDRTWAAIGEHLLDDATEYAAHLTPDMASQAASEAKSVDDLRAEGVYRVVTPDECVALAEEVGPMGGITLHPLCAGVDPDIGWESLHLYNDRVKPLLALR